MNKEANAHHLVLGTLKDFLSGQEIPDTHDERYRQKIAQKLVTQKGFDRQDIEANRVVHVTAGEKKAGIKADFCLSVQNRRMVMIKYAPGSLVTRRLSTLALSRVIDPDQIPIVVITNGEDAEIMDGNTGCVINTGLDNLPHKTWLEDNLQTFVCKKINPGLYDKASRIVYACEVDGACPCDTDICRMND